ncbi:MAG: DAK2 domain-containing protein [Candidatus Izemoplasmataceae bacterium]
MSTTINVLDNKRLYHSFMAGAREVISHKNTLNAINVFPVIDGDTGTNLASMMHTILNESRLEDNVEKTLESIADAALIGARGNSGIIFAQYLNGLINALKKETPIDLDHYARSIKEAVPYAYEAISNPVEGTMITLMREWGEAIERQRSIRKDFLDTLLAAYEILKHSLQKTTETLKVLRDHKVVDAGAKGFLHFTEGFIDYIQTGKTRDLPVQATSEKLETTHEDASEETFRYCTEALISGHKLDTRAIRKTMQKYGDSLVVAGNDKRVRLHIHTDVPQDVFHDLRSFGHIDEQKIDDMVKQHEIIHNRKYPIALVTDSIADVPQDIIDNEQIHVIPLNLIIEGSNYYDRLTITAERFYEVMDEVETYPSSAQPNLKQMENFFSFLSSHYDKILALTVSSKMSGTYSIFEKAAQSIRDEGTDIRIIDTRQNSGAEGLLVKEAAEMIAKGEDLDTIERAIKAKRDDVKILVSVQTLKYMVRSGRVGKVTGIIGKITNLKPVISIDHEGEGMIYSKGVSIKGSTRKIMDHIAKTHASKGIKRYVIVHAASPERARDYEKTLTGMLGMAPEYIMTISPIVAMNAGIGTVAVAYQTEPTQN